MASYMLWHLMNERFLFYFSKFQVSNISIIFFVISAFTFSNQNEPEPKNDLTFYNVSFLSSCGLHVNISKFHVVYARTGVRI